MSDKPWDLDQKHLRSPAQQERPLPRELADLLPGRVTADHERVVQRYRSCVERVYELEREYERRLESDKTDAAAAAYAGAPHPAPTAPAVAAELRQAREELDAGRSALHTSAAVQVGVACDYAPVALERAWATAQNVLGEVVLDAIDASLAGVDEAGRALAAAGYIAGGLETRRVLPFMGEHVALPGHLQAAAQALREAKREIEDELEGRKWPGRTIAAAVPGTLSHPASGHVGPGEGRAAQREQGFRTGGDWQVR